MIEKFAFRLDNEQFKQLMLKLDPYHTNSISYHDFLKLFEETDTPVSQPIRFKIPGIISNFVMCKELKKLNNDRVFM